jgi:two-component system chemotaxis sensor kinase CheA
MSEHDELLREFLIETKENLDNLDAELLALETSPSDSSLINSIFRRLHTIKGVCGFLDFSKLEGVSHAGETLLDELRNSRVAVDDKVINLLLRLCDAIRMIVLEIEQSGDSEGSNDYAQLIGELLDCAARKGGAKVATPAPKLAEAKEASDIKSAHDLSQSINLSSSEDAPQKKELSLDEEFEALLDMRSQPKDPQPVVEVCSAAVVTETAKDTAEREQQIDAGQVPASQREGSLRVDVELLDYLMNLAGELVLARNQILRSTQALNDPNFKAITQRLNLVTSELQEGVMRTRMQPISAVWGKFPRIVRDLAQSCGKKVRLEMHGKETELDKTLIEAIKDPLTHIIRNSIDHGIEVPNDRIAKGKPAEGCVTMGAFQEGGYVIIEIVDDGAGLNTEKIRRRAVERGLVSAERASSLSEGEVHRLIFAPGFSTADTVTNLSGRGVGMDVVKSSVERIGGQVDIASWFGEGSTIRLKIPLTLAIIPALLLSSIGQRFAVPQSAITELAQFSASARSGALSWVGEYPFYKLRQELIPLIFLNKQLGSLGELSADYQERQVIVVLDVDGCRFGVVVDEVYDTEEIVVKPLGGMLSDLGIYAGATILGDGEIALILDPVVLAREAQVDKREAAAKSELASDGVAIRSADLNDEQLLIVELSEDLRAAIPLARVRRLEQLNLNSVEQVGKTRLVQYRGSLLQLLDLSERLAAASSLSRDGSVVVIANGDDSLGLQVARIVDVTPRLEAYKPAQGEPGISGYGVVQGRIVALLNMDEVTAS